MIQARTHKGLDKGGDNSGGGEKCSILGMFIKSSNRIASGLDGGMRKRKVPKMALLQLVK